MPRLMHPSRRLPILSGLLTVFALGACKEADDHHGEEVDFMRITLTGQAPVLVNSTGAVSGTLTLTQHVATGVTVEFLDATQQDALGEHADEFQANVSPAAGITFNRTGPFTGTLTGTATGAIPVSFAMFHLEDAEEEFGPFNVTITVNAPPASRD